MSPFELLGTSRLDPKAEEGSVPSPEPAVANPAPAEPAASAEPLTGDQTEDLRQRIIAALCTCFDPEIPVNIYELGLIYEIVIDPAGAVNVHMTLTTPACPAATSLPPEVQHKVETLPGVKSAKVDVVWEPPWDKSRMSEAAKLQLGIDDW